MAEKKVKRKGKVKGERRIEKRKENNRKEVSRLGVEKRENGETE